MCDCRFKTQIEEGDARMRKGRLIHGGGCVGLISTGKNHWRFFIPLFVICWIVGFIANYLRAHQGTSTILYCNVEFFGIFIDAVWMGYFAFVIVSRSIRVGTLGFTIDRRIVVPLLLSVATLISIAFQKGTKTSSVVFLAAPLAVVEEIIFRVFLIEYFRKRFAGWRSAGAKAVIASSFVWTLAHVHSKGFLPFVEGIFLGGLIFGFVYYLTGSDLLGFVAHVTSNAGVPAGMGVLIFYFLISLLLLSYRRKWRSCVVHAVPQV